MMTVQPHIEEITEEGIVFSLQEDCATEYKRRKSLRRRSSDVRVEILQNGVLFSEFSQTSRFIVSHRNIDESFAAFRYLNAEERVTLIMKNRTISSTRERADNGHRRTTDKNVHH
jgi:hypothetical protein